MDKGKTPAGWRSSQKPKKEPGPKFSVGQRVRVVHLMCGQLISDLNLLESGLPRIRIGELGTVISVEDAQKIYRNESQRWEYGVRIDAHPQDTYWNEIELELA